MEGFSSIVKRTDSSAFRARVCLFLIKKVALLTFIFVVQDRIIIISSEKGYPLLSYVCFQRKYYTPYGKIFFQML